MKNRYAHKILTAGIITAAILGIGLLVGLALVLIHIGGSTDNSSTLNDSDIRAISSLVKFGATQTDNYLYQSSLFNFQVEINTNKYNYAETARGLTVTDKNTDNQVTFNVSGNTDNLSLSAAVTDYENTNKYLSSFTVISDVGITIDGTVASRITYSYKDFNNKPVQIIAVVMVTQRFIYEIQYTNFNSDVKDPGLFDGLISTFKFINGAVKGVAAEAGLDEKTAILAKPAVVQIFFQKCGELYIPFESAYPNTTGKTYNLCSAATGSGFFINSKGYVATNGHVVSQSVDTFKANAGSKRLFINLFRDLILPTLQKYDPADYSSMTDSQIITYLKDNTADAQNILLVNTNLISYAYTSMNFSETAYVQKGSNAFTTGTDTTNLANTDDHYEADIIDMDYSAKLGADGKEISSDIAILKIVDGDYPILHLGSNEFAIPGTQIMAIGFPGAADTLDMIDTSVASEATFTKGVISRIVDTTGGRKIIQIDASINHGNSGGPLISSDDGTVLGLNTYGVDAGSSDFNYARDVADLKALMVKNNITNTAGTTQQKLEEGVNFFFNGYYSKAITSLQTAKSSDADIEGLDTIIALSQKKVAQGLDKVDAQPKSNDIFTTFSNLSSTEQILIIVVVSLICLVLFIIFGMLIVFKRLRKRAVVPQTVAVEDGKLPLK